MLRLKLILSGALVILWPWAAAAQIPLTITNAGFEADAPGSVPSGWTVATGGNPFWVGDTSLAGADPGSGAVGPQFISANWPYGGLPNASSLVGGDAYSSLVYQDIDLSPYGAEISQGGLYLGLSYYYFDVDTNDLGTIAYDFLDGGNAVIGGGYAGDTQQQGSWQFVEDLAATEVPTNAATLRISLGAERIGVGTQRNIAFDAISASLQPPPPPESPSGVVHGNLIQFDSAGAWTWYTDERAIVDPNNGRVLVNSVGFDETVDGSYPGEVDVVDFNPTTGRRVRTRLSNQQPGNPVIQNDDHNVGALLVLPDGRYLAMYANHGNNGGLGDEWSRWRRSINPGDSTSWTTEQLFNWYDEVPGANQTGNPDQANVSYHNLFYLAEEDQVYDISRSYGQLSTNGAGQNMPNVLRYDMETNTVEWAGQLLESEAQGYSAYPKYVSDGMSRIYFTTTETHPRNYNNSIFAGYIEGGQTFDMQGNLVDPDIFDNGTPEGGSGFVSDVTDYTLVQAADPLGEGYNRLWTTDTAIDSTGAPMALFTSRWNPDGSTNDGSTNNLIDHRLHFARWDQSTQTWETQEVAKMGGRLYGPEQDYTGLGALVPGDENTLYVSTPFDPRDPTGQTETTNHEIYKGEFDGSQWNWTAVTENSSVDNLRPIVPDNHGEGARTVIWFRGDYNTAHDINAAVVGVVERDDERVGLVNYLDADAGNTRFASGSSLSTTGPSAGQGGDDNQWHERTGFGNGGSVLTSNETGTENAPMLQTTVEGLGDGLYDVFAYFWSDNDEDWRLLAGLEQDNLVDFRMYGSQHAEEGQFVSIDEVSANSNDLLLYRAYLGRSQVMNGSAIEVFVDDWQAIGGDNANRTWYDGVGYALVGSMLPGDFNGDGVVDAADYTVWREGYVAGQYTQQDYLNWRANYGAMSDTAVAASAPEPTTLSLAAVGAALAARRRLNRRRRPHNSQAASAAHW